MKQKQFIQSVQLLASPEDFNQHEDLLHDIKPWLYDAFLNCLKLGMMIFQAEKLVNKADDLSREISLSPEQIITLLPEFKLLVSLMNEKKIPLNIVIKSEADLTKVIDTKVNATKLENGYYRLQSDTLIPESEIGKFLNDYLRTHFTSGSILFESGAGTISFSLKN